MKRFPWDKTAGDTRRMSGCCAIHYSAAAVTHWLHSCFIWNGMLLRCWTSRKKILYARHVRAEDGETCLSGTVITQSVIFYEACTTYKILSILCLHISGNNSKNVFYCILLCLVKYSRRTRWPCQCSGRKGLQSLSAGQGRQWKVHEFCMLHIINTHIWREERQQCGHQYLSALELFACFYLSNRNTARHISSPVRSNHNDNDLQHSVRTCLTV